MVRWYYYSPDWEASYFLCPIQASSPLQVKYADGELERLGVIHLPCS